MRKALKGLGYFVVLIIAVASALALYIAITGIPSYAPGNVNLKVETSAAKVERGRKFASMLCVGCHLDPTTGKLTGKRLADLPTVFGVAFSKNITRDPVYGIGSWSDGELAYLLRTGITRAGRSESARGLQAIIPGEVADPRDLQASAISKSSDSNSVGIRSSCIRQVPVRKSRMF